MLALLYYGDGLPTCICLFLVCLFITFYNVPIMMLLAFGYYIEQKEDHTLAYRVWSFICIALGSAECEHRVYYTIIFAYVVPIMLL